MTDIVNMAPSTHGNVSQEFQFTSSTPTLIMCSLYMVLGIVAILANLLDILIFVTNNELRRKYIFFVAIDVGELVDGLSYVLTSIGRGSGVLTGTFPQPISIHDCFFKRYWVHALIMGTELPALITIVISIERILAVHKPKVYNKYVTTRTKILSLVTVVFIQLVFLSAAGFSAYGNTEMATTRHCAIITSTATYFSIFHFVFVVSAYVVSFTSLLITYVVYKNMERRAFGAKRKTQLVLFLFVTGTSIIFVSMPGIVMIGIRLHLFAVNDLIVGLTYSTTGFLSIMNTIMNYKFRPEYRAQVNLLFGNTPKKKESVARVIHISTINVHELPHFKNTQAPLKKISVSYYLVQKIFV
ncbi:hypothetical protein L596_023048 [Steinernema carpocapsae]|uniref:G-protein coupled receptors family 1 profile domain-containing protein n=1 Tax=Steinernema carpocapsae TaxID=34508 RepID=A0A4U5MCH3_STECR|nr:hypothetical protein L596_023048 [Steinernema carpocapsae]